MLKNIFLFLKKKLKIKKHLKTKKTKSNSTEFQ